MRSVDREFGSWAEEDLVDWTVYMGWWAVFGVLGIGMGWLVGWLRSLSSCPDGWDGILGYILMV